jgi:hypothetical protein
MARNLFMLGHLTGNEEYLLRSEEMLKKMVPQIKRNPAFHANWASLLSDFITGPATISIVGPESRLFLKEFAGHYLPNAIFSESLTNTAVQYDRNLHPEGKTLIYICQGKTCYRPVETVSEALQILFSCSAAFSEGKSRKFEISNTRNHGNTESPRNS